MAEGKMEEEAKAGTSLLDLAKEVNKQQTLPTFIPKAFKATMDLEDAPQNFGGSMVVKAGLKSYKKKTPIRFFRISNRAWGIIVGDY